MLRTDDALLADLEADAGEPRWQAVDELRRSPRPLPPALRAALEKLAATGADPRMRALGAEVLAACDAVGRIGRVSSAGEPAPARPALVEALLRSQDPRLRQRALEAIAQQPAEYVDAIVGWFSTSADVALLCELMPLAVRTGSASLVPALESLLGRQEAALRQGAVDALGALIGASPSPALRAKLEALSTADPHPDVRFAARRALGQRRGGPGADESPAAAPARFTPAELTAQLADPAPERRLEALERAAASRDELLADAIAGALPGETDARVLARMASALRGLGSEQHAPAVRALLKHTDDRVCANAVETLVHLAGEVAVQSLLPLLARDDNRLKANLMIALRDRFGDQVMGYVRRMLKSDRFSYRISGLYCARHMDHEEIYPDVARMLVDEPNPDVLREALVWAAELGPPARVLQDLGDLARVRPPDAVAIHAAEARVRRRLEGANPSPEPTASAPLSSPVPPPPPLSVEPPAGRSGAVARLRPATRSGVIAPPAPVAHGWRADPRFPLAVFVAVVVGLAAWTGWRVQQDSLRTERDQERERRAAEERIASTAHRGVVMRTSGPPEKCDVALVVNGMPVTLRWPATAGTPPAPGATLVLTGPRLVKGDDGEYRVTAAAIHTAP